MASTRSQEYSVNASITDSSLGKKAAHNAVSGLFFFVLNTLVSLVLNPILVHYLGSTYFGIWKSIDHFLGFASIADGKGAQALKWTIANQEASRDLEKKQREVASAVLVWGVFLPVLVILTLTLAYFSPYLIKDVNPAEHGLIRLIVLLLGLNLIISPLFGISEAVLIGVNRGYISSYIRAFWLILSAFLMYGMLVYGYGIVQLAMVTVAITLFRGVHYYLSCKRRISWFGVMRPTKDELATFFRFSSWKLLWSFIARFFTSGEIIFLSILVGAGSVSQYVFTAYIAVTGVTVTAIASSAITPGLGRLIGNAELEKSRKVIAQLRELVLATALFIAAGMLLLNKSFVFLWAGPELFLGEENNILIAVLMIQLVIIKNEAFLIDLSLKIKTKVLLGIASVGLTLFFIVLMQRYISQSISAIFVAIFLGRLLLLMLFPRITNKIVSFEPASFLRYRTLVYALLFLLLSGGIGLVQHFESWTAFVVMGSIESMVCALFLYAFVLTDANRGMITSQLLRLKTRIRRKP